MGGVARRADLRGDIAPARGRLEREGGVAAGELVEPASNLCPVGRPDLPAGALARLGVDPVEGDLCTVHVQTHYDPHGTSSSSAA